MIYSEGWGGPLNRVDSLSYLDDHGVSPSCLRPLQHLCHYIVPWHRAAAIVSISTLTAAESFRAATSRIESVSIRTVTWRRVGATGTNMYTCTMDTSPRTESVTRIHPALAIVQRCERRINFSCSLAAWPRCHQSRTMPMPRPVLSPWSWPLWPEHTSAAATQREPRNSPLGPAEDWGRNVSIRASADAPNYYSRRGLGIQQLRCQLRADHTGDGVHVHLGQCQLQVGLTPTLLATSLQASDGYAASRPRAAAMRPGTCWNEGVSGMCTLRGRGSTHRVRFLCEANLLCQWYP